MSVMVTIRIYVDKIEEYDNLSRIKAQELLQTVLNEVTIVQENV